MINTQIRTMAKERGVRLWEIADELHMQESQFHKILRYPLSDELRATIVSAIEKLSKKEDV
jgi:hypothetical protein